MVVFLNSFFGFVQDLLSCLLGLIQYFAGRLGSLVEKPGSFLSFV